MLSILRILMLLALLLIFSGVAHAQEDDEATPTPAPLRIEIVERDAGFPLSLEFAPDGRLFYVARGRGAVMVNNLEKDDDDQFLPSTVVLDGLPTPIGSGDGVLSMALHPDFENNHALYVYYTEIDERGVTQRVPVVRYTEVDGVATDETLIVADIPTRPLQRFHFGGALSFGPDGKLYLMYGDMDDSATATDLDSQGGSILRYNADGTIPDDNPFPDSPIYSYGHRNGFGLAWHPTSGVLYESENGMFCDDELNRILPGAYYGWGTVAPETCPYPDDEGEAPIWEWTPNIAPTGMLFYTGDDFPELADSLLMCAFNTGVIHRIQLNDEGTTVVDETGLLMGELRPYCQLDIAQGPDGAIYTATTDFIFRISRP